MSDPVGTMGSKRSKEAQRGVYPPLFCRWRLLGAVAAVTQVSVLLMGVGAMKEFSLVWLGVVSLYAQGLALVTALGVCISRAWLGRLSVRGAWIGSWIVAVIVALAFSYSAGIVGTVLGLGPGRHDFAVFVLQSVLAVALVGIALLRYLFIRGQWRAQVLAQSEARVQALQARIRPHFLFNSLNTIASLIPEEPANAEQAIEDLADIFRGSMRRADTLISLSEELELARQYLQMEQRRLGDRLRLSWRVSDLPEGASVLPLMLQPLLENAVAHGIQPRADGGELKVYGRAEKDNIVITIANPVAPGALENPGHGMALANIRERMELAFGPAASLVTHKNEEQFFAVLTLPYVENTDH
jgi:two-component system sensor histidine kinase AlgZ